MSSVFEIADTCMRNVQQGESEVDCVPGEPGLFVFPVHGLWRIRLPTLADFSKHLKSFREPQFLREEWAASQPSLQPHTRGMLVGRNFLNCTKNIELTGARFARTFSFALQEKSRKHTSRWAGESSADKRLHQRIRARHMKSDQWKTYRTRFLVKAKRLNANLSFVDHLGRQHAGCKGDYLVESSEGVISIAPRQIFEDIYVAMIEEDTSLHHTQIREARVSRKAPQPCQESTFRSPALA